MEKGKSSILGSTRLRFKRSHRVKTKVEIIEGDNDKQRVDINNI